MKPENSLILSMATGCIPGVVYNLEKYRQIECSYYKCLRDYTKIGWPKFFCSSTRASSKCKYVYGQVFWTIPWTAFADYAMNIVKDYFANPLSVLFTAAEIACDRFSGSNIATATCAIKKAGRILGTVNDALDAFRQAKDWKFQQPFDFCKELDEERSAGGAVTGGPA